MRRSRLCVDSWRNERRRLPGPTTSPERRPRMTLSQFCPRCGHAASGADVFCRDCGFRLEPSLTDNPSGQHQPPIVRRRRQGWGRIAIEVLVATMVVLAVGGLVWAGVAGTSPFTAQLSETERIWCEANALPVVGAIMRQSPRPAPPIFSFDIELPWEQVQFALQSDSTDPMYPRAVRSFKDWRSFHQDAYRIGCLLAFAER